MKYLRKTLSLILICLLTFGTVAIGGNGFAEVFETFSLKASAYSTGDYIYYGTYPQSKVTDSALVSALNGAGSSWKSYGYYSGTGNGTDGQMKPSDYMRYKDVSYNGSKYRAVTFDSYRPYCTGYTSSSNAQQGNGYYTGNVYWFKYEPIKWRVLDPSTGLIMCDTAIDSQAYNNYIWYGVGSLSSSSECYGDEAHTYYASNYAKSSIRAWLNKDFYDTAFSSEQKSNIIATTLDNSSTYSSAYDAPSTTDKIFLLSYKDSINSNYGFSSSDSAYDTTRQMKSTDYAKCQGCEQSTSDSYRGNCWWWLRSPNDSHDARRVNSDGYSYSLSSYYVYHTSRGVVPALRLSNLKSDYAGSEISSVGSTKNSAKKNDKTETKNQTTAKAEINPTTEKSSKNAIIVIPGITGSELYKGKELVWLGFNTYYNVIEDLLDDLVDSSIYAKTNPFSHWLKYAVNYLACYKNGNSIYPLSAKDNPNDELYGTKMPGTLADGAYTKLMKKMNDFVKSKDNNGYYDEVIFFPYDWRLTNSKSAYNLNSLIENYNKVTLVAHSMGGIVACKYLADYGTDKLEKLITLGTPFYGAPKAFYAFETGLFLDGVLGNATSALIKNISPNVPGLYELLPTENFGSYLCSDKKSISFDKTFNELKKYGWFNEKLYNEAIDLHNTIIPIYQKIKNRDINAYVVVGDYIEEKQFVTINSFSTSPLASSLIKKLDFMSLGSQLYCVPEMGSGDGTVPLKSATMNYSINKGNLFYAKNIKHTPLASSKKTLNLVTELLKGNEAPKIDGISKTRYSDERLNNTEFRITVSSDSKITVKDGSKTVIEYIPNNYINFYNEGYSVPNGLIIKAAAAENEPELKTGFILCDEKYENLAYTCNTDCSFVTFYLPSEDYDISVDAQKGDKIEFLVEKLNGENVLLSKNVTTDNLEHNGLVSLKNSVDDDLSLEIDYYKDGTIDKTVLGKEPDTVSFSENSNNQKLITIIVVLLTIIVLAIVTLLISKELKNEKKIGKTKSMKSDINNTTGFSFNESGYGGVCQICNKSVDKLWVSTMKADGKPCSYLLCSTCISKFVNNASQNNNSEKETYSNNRDEISSLFTDEYTKPENNHENNKFGKKEVIISFVVLILCAAIICGALLLRNHLKSYNEETHIDDISEIWDYEDDSETKASKVLYSEREDSETTVTETANQITKVLTDTKSDREKALSSYYDYLKTNDWIEKYDGKQVKFTVFDLHNDDIPEVCAYYDEPNNWTIVILSYDGNLREYKMSGEFGDPAEFVTDVNEEQGTFFTGRMRGKNICTMYKLDEYGKAEELFRCFPGYFEDEGYEQVEKEYNEYMEEMTPVKYVQVNTDNLNKYLG